VAANPRRRSLVLYRDNRVRRYDDNRRRIRRRYRDNPAVAAAGLGGISISRPLSLIMPVAVGFAARYATLKVPQMLSIVNPLPRFGVKAAVAVGGGLVLNRFVGKTNATIWTVVGLVTLAEDILNTYVFQQAVATAGLGAYTPEMGEVGAFPSSAEGMGAYPFGGAEPAY